MTLVVASMVDGLISANHAMTVCQTTAIPETTLLLLPLVAIGSRQSHVVSWARTSGFSPPGSSNSERQPVAGRPLVSIPSKIEQLRTRRRAAAVRKVLEVVARSAQDRGIKRRAAAMARDRCLSGYIFKGLLALRSPTSSSWICDRRVTRPAVQAIPEEPALATRGSGT